MWFIQHRVNAAAGLRALPTAYGAEIDVRYHCDDLVLEHDPLHHHERHPERLDEWLTGWHHDGPLILNVKTEGIEQICIELVHRHGVRNWFFLDLSPPYLVKYSLFAERGEIAGFAPQNLAVRFSQYEPIEGVMAFTGRVGWVWVDCFSRLPLDARTSRLLRQAGFKLCIVSPELQHHPLDRIKEFADQLSDITVDAICTKRPDLWSRLAQPTLAG